MRKKHFLFVSLIILMGLPLQAQIQRGPAREKADYETAARFSMKKYARWSLPQAYVPCVQKFGPVLVYL